MKQFNWKKRIFLIDEGMLLIKFVHEFEKEQYIIDMFCWKIVMFYHCDVFSAKKKNGSSFEIIPDRQKKQF